MACREASTVDACKKLGQAFGVEPRGEVMRGRDFAQHVEVVHAELIVPHAGLHHHCGSVGAVPLTHSSGQARTITSMG